VTAWLARLRRLRMHFTRCRRPGSIASNAFCQPYRPCHPRRPSHQLTGSPHRRLSS
jgi:hypothetical protein